MLRSRLAVTLVVVLAVVSGCSGEEPPPAKAGDAYVALGDSYVAGPGIAAEDKDSPECRRSLTNYPSLVAKKLKPETFIDVSCGGATTATVLDGKTTAQGTVVDPQLDSLTSKTELVTVGIGGNEGGASAGLFAYCLIKPTATDAACQKLATTYLPNVYPAMGTAVSGLLGEIKTKAPKARIVLVGYLRLMPDQGNCDVLPVSEANRAIVEKAEIAWDDILREAAKKADVTYVDMRQASKGHDACAGDDAWVNGVRSVPGDGAYLHPNAEGMKQTAREVLKVVGDD